MPLIFLSLMLCYSVVTFNSNNNHLLITGALAFQSTFNWETGNLYHKKKQFTPSAINLFNYEIPNDCVGVGAVRMFSRDKRNLKIRTLRAKNRRFCVVPSFTD